MLNFPTDTPHGQAVDRDAICIHWNLAGYIYCVPADLDAFEEGQLIVTMRQQMGDTFRTCPTEYVRQRMVGGVRCPLHENRVHVAHGAFYYSMMAADSGVFYPLDYDQRVSFATLYRSGAGELWTGTGPFTEGIND